MGPSELAAGVESLLRERASLQVQFAADEAQQELLRLGLATELHQGVISVVGLRQATRVVQKHWDGLLWDRVARILGEVEQEA
jgi:hypothetical protein